MNLAIFGASGHGKVVADTAIACGWASIVFFDDAWPGKKINSVWPVQGNFESMTQNSTSFDGFIIAIGNNLVRLEYLNKLFSLKLPVPTLRHPMAYVSPSACLGAGSVIFAGSVVQADAKIGLGCIVNTGASVDHDCLLGDAVHLSPGVHLAGGVTIGNKSWLGIGTSVKQMLKIGADCIVGAGSVVLNDIQDETTVVGVPARLMDKKSNA